LWELASKRTLSRLAWRRKRRWHDPAVLAAIAADIAAYGPDHIALTGDLTNFATPGEFAAARAWLETLAPAAAVTVSPGNHDALVSYGQADRFASLAPWFGDDDGGGFPRVRRRGPVAIVNLSSAIATPPLFAGGTLGRDQIGRLGEVLGALGREGVIRIVLLHHPPGAGVVSGRKALADASALRVVLARHGAELVLHGHAHEAVFCVMAGPRGAIPVLGVPSASSPVGSPHAAARWHAIEFDAQGAIRVIARGLDRQGGGIVELGRYLLPAATSGIAA